jgi:hypothetical protein
VNALAFVPVERALNIRPATAAGVKDFIADLTFGIVDICHPPFVELTTPSNEVT